MEFEYKASCPLCCGPLSRSVEGDTGQRVEWKVCQFCGAIWGPPWLEHQWTEPSSEPALLYILNHKEDQQSIAA